MASGYAGKIQDDIASPASSNKVLPVGLGLEIGDLSSPTWALTPGYRYIYYVHRRTFVVYDENNTMLNSKDNIRSVGDMGISFEIYKSHQFIIMISTSDSRYPFYIPVHMDEYKWASSVIYDDLHGILNYYPGDSSRPYDVNDVNNPSNIVHYIDGFVNIISGRSYIRDELSGIGDIVDHKYLLKSDIQFMNKILDPIVINSGRKTPAFRHGDISPQLGKHIEKSVCSD